MLLTFKGPPPPGKGYARHLNDDQWDNVLENLAWGSPKDNYDDAVRNGSLGKGSLAAIAGGFKRWGNTNARGNTNWLGRKHTEQTKAKIQEKMRGNTNALGSTHRLGRKHTEQSKEKMRAAHAVHKVLKEFLG
jgi:hypothetical protein